MYLSPKGRDVPKRANTTLHIPDPGHETTTNHGTTQPTATEPLSKAAWGATEPATCTQTTDTMWGRQQAETVGVRQREERMREEAMNGPNFIGCSLLFL